GLPQAIALSMRRANGSPIIGQGSFDQTLRPLYDFNTGMGNVSDAYSFGTHSAEVEVDRETGQVDIRRMAVSHDCGFAINPLLIEGQVEGASLMGSGYALTEELRRQDGATLNPSFLEYKVPTALDGFEMGGATVESIDPGGPYGAKEAGEGLMIAAAPAVTNAIFNAVGIRMMETPVTPEKVLRALEESARATG
ncbi:MAG: molybdopterin-dependent oxidoreductase, partial [Dehalococcoidia bacterium]|nr:molybdopterin-dependent oxidoreductase [Dehalococcoidia bacterium]